MTLFPGVALVTGAASGIGQATAISFAREGCRKIAIADRNAAGLAETSKLIEEAGSGEIVHIVSQTVDISQEAQVEDFIHRVVRDLGRIDYAANCAGILSNNQPSTGTSAADFDKINSVNYRGCWLSSRAEIKQMLGQEPLPSHDGRRGNRGSIVNIASQLGIVGRPAAPAYCASKAAVISMTQCDAIDYSKDNIRINCVCPGVIDTPMTRPQMDVLGPAISIAPMNRAGTAQEISDAVLFLCSSKATFVQGSAMVVDGGYTIN
ncbi:uncharacterized protein MYCFIDRAFT_57797 [Pseudocercospora fijiensis CIRAD86]|uniref:Uncharacterized protein n=1 Tax=Pseudocercospora fijiensis (strain CIRAD86) TaxID=383855 RepID=M3A3C4_PSEFD|nr:uncharacterized protein MYCFIDRAFT_57797 [Pseudocercospora fijiensis CIRAD86]EME79141.1 hypothetical protein MYCFIDRAFT_57797 [Pseudocercospora fijiensis CIRAD86]